MIALEGVQDEGFVRLRDLCTLKSALVGQVKFNGDGSSLQSGSLGVHLHVDCLVRLDSDNQLVSRNVGEDSGGDILVLNSDFDLSLVKS